jgi:hypothetical protein
MYPRRTLADFLADRVVYRNLRPADPGLPRLEDIWQQVGLEEYRVPRKTEPAYAATVVHLLQAAQAGRGWPALTGVLFIGDTHMNDGTAARNIAEHLPLRGFIGADRPGQPAKAHCDGPLMIANRWRCLEDWLIWVRREGMVCDERTAVLVDVDKTCIGARGRNDKVIDGARVAAVRQTMDEVLGGAFDEGSFLAVYDRLCQPEYHPFTADNQDYLAYISLMVMGQVVPLGEFWQEVEAGYLTGFLQFLNLCDTRRGRMPPGLGQVHAEVMANVRRGDPTPFKTFRYREYFATVNRMDFMPDDTPPAELLANEITITEEVGRTIQTLAENGALTFGISDKPDEASLPPTGSTGEGKMPLHRVRMKVTGA